MEGRVCSQSLKYLLCGTLKEESLLTTAVDVGDIRVIKTCEVSTLTQKIYIGFAF